MADSAIESGGAEIRFYRTTSAHGYLSNLFTSPVVFEGREFSCAEKAYQYGKPSDPLVADWLVQAPTPSLCAIAAHALLPWHVRPDWNAIKVDRMRGVLEAKFTQNHELWRKLVATGNALLVEDSKTDAFWGVGKKGTGRNMLGCLLMKLRDQFWELAP